MGKTPSTFARASPPWGGRSLRPVGSKFRLKAQSLTQPADSFAPGVSVPGNKEEAYIGVRESKQNSFISPSVCCTAASWEQCIQSCTLLQDLSPSLHSWIMKTMSGQLVFFLFFKGDTFCKDGLPKPGGTPPLQPYWLPLLMTLFTGVHQEHWPAFQSDTNVFIATFKPLNRVTVVEN